MGKTLPLNILLLHLYIFQMLNKVLNFYSTLRKLTLSYHVFRKVTSSERNRDVLTLDRKIERAGGREVVSRSRSTRHKRNYKSDLQQNQHRPSKIVESRTNNTYFDSFVQGKSSPIGNQR